MKILQFVSPFLLALHSVVASPIVPSPVEAPQELSARNELEFGGIKLYTSSHRDDRGQVVNRFRVLGAVRVLTPALRDAFREGGRGLELARSFFGDFRDTCLDMFTNTESFQAVFKAALTEGASIIGFQWESGTAADYVLEEVTEYFTDNNMVPVSQQEVKDAFAAGGGLHLGPGKRSGQSVGASCSRHDLVSLFRPWVEWDEGSPLQAATC